MRSNWPWPLIIALLLGLVLIVLLSVYGVRYDTRQRQEVLDKLNNCMMEQMEYAYAEGQLDALHGDWRIAETSSNEWHWVKSPWDFDRKPAYGTLMQKVEKAD